MKLLLTKATTNVTLLVFIQDSSSTTGAGNTGLLATNLTAYYTRVEDDNDVTIAAISLSDLTGTGTVHTDGGIEEIASVNMPGWYRLDIPDAVVATGARSAGISIIDSGANNVAQVTIEIQLVDIDLEDSVRMGMTALPNAAADAAGGLPISDAGGLDLDAMNTNINDIETDTADMQPKLGTISNLGGGATIGDNLSDMAGATFSTTTDTLEAIRNQGDTAWITAVGFSTHSAANVRTEMDSNSTKLASIETDTQDIQTQVGTAGAGLTDLGGMSTAMKAEVQVEANDALIANNLDHLVLSAVDTDFITTVDPDSVIGHLAHDGTGTGTGGGGFFRDTDSLEAIRDNMQTAVDAAIDTAISELGVAAPTATPTLRTGLMLLYMALRNQTIVQTSATDALEIYNDAGTLIAKKLLTDDGSDYTEAEMSSG